MTPLFKYLERNIRPVWKSHNAEEGIYDTSNGI